MTGCGRTLFPLQRSARAARDLRRRAIERRQSDEDHTRVLADLAGHGGRVPAALGAQASARREDWTRGWVLVESRGTAWGIRLAARKCTARCSHVPERRRLEGRGILRASRAS